MPPLMNQTKSEKIVIVNIPSQPNLINTMKAFLFASYVGLFVSSCPCSAEETAAEQVARLAAESEMVKKSEYNKKYDATIDKLEAKYPDCFDNQTPFYKAFSPRFDDAIKSKDPVTQDPEWVFHLAEVVAHQLAAKGISVTVKELPEGDEAIRIAATQNQKEFDQAQAQKTARPPVDQVAAQIPIQDKRKADEAQRIAAERAEQAAADAGDIQAYLRQAAKGQAGQNPRAQAMARSSRNPQAQQAGLRMLKIQGQENLVRRNVAAGRISAEEADLEMARIEQQDTQQQLLNEQRQMIEEQKRANEELYRLRMEMQKMEMQNRRYRP